MLEQSARVAGVDGLTIAPPVALRQVQAGIATGAAPSTAGITTTMLAVDTNHAGDLLRGRIDQGWAAATAGLAPRPGPGVPVAAGTREARLTCGSSRVRADLGEGVDAVTAASLVVQDARGARATLDLRQMPAADGAAPDAPSEHTIALPDGLGPVRLHPGSPCACPCPPTSGR